MKYIFVTFIANDPSLVLNYIEILNELAYSNMYLPTLNIPLLKNFANFLLKHKQIYKIL